MHRERETDRQTDRDREADRDKEREIEADRHRPTQTKNGLRHRCRVTDTDVVLKPMT